MKKYLAVFVWGMMFCVNAYASCRFHFRGITYTCEGDYLNMNLNPADVISDDCVFGGWAGDTSDPNVVLPGVATPNGERPNGDGTTYPVYRYYVPFAQSGISCADIDVDINITPICLVIPTSKSYVDAAVATRQNKFVSLGANKLMTYPTQLGGTPGSRDIVATLGTPNANTGDYSNTNDTTIPTTGAVNAAIAAKQDVNAINGTANYVMTHTGTAGVLGEKAIYGTGTQLSDALVEVGTLNSAVINAVNSELTPVSGIGWRINTVENLTLPALRTPVPDASISADFRCTRALSGDVSYSTYDCNSAAIVSELGAQDNKSGRFGAPFEYGNIIGRSVCSAIAGSEQGQVATDAENATMDSEFTSQTGIGTSALNESQLNCWCKTESWDGAPMVSSWVFVQSRASSEICANACSNLCGNRLRGNEAFRTALYNSVQ